MTRTPTPRLRVYGVLSVTALLAGLALGRPELAALATPVLLALVGGLVAVRDIELEVDIDADRNRALEGDLFGLVITVSANQPLPRLVIEPSAPAGLRLRHMAATDEGPPARTEAGRLAVSLTAGESRTLRFEYECVQWGGYPSVGFSFSVGDLFGLFRFTSLRTGVVSLRVFPRSEDLPRLLSPLETQLSVGDLSSRRRGAGTEFSELRPFSPGDDLRRVNWRASARRDELWLNDHHPDSNSDVVLLVDTPAGSRLLDELALDYAVRAVAALTRAHLGRRDRVGLIVFGGVVRWLRPAVIADQRYQILDALADSRLKGGVLSVTSLPRRALPPKAIVIGLSPLLEPASVLAFQELRGRGTDLALIEFATSRLLPEPNSDDRRLARRMWELERDQMRRQFRNRGVALAEWDPQDPFINALEEVSAFRTAQIRR